MHQTPAPIRRPVAKAAGAARRPAKPTPPVHPRQAMLQTKVAPTDPANDLALIDLENLLREQVAAYRGLATLLEDSRLAMSEMRLRDLTELTKTQAATRDRLVSLEHRRQAMLRRLTNERQPPTLAQLAERYPARSKVLLGLRDQLKQATSDAARRSRLAGGVAGGVLGHLNTAVRLIDESTGQQRTYATDGGLVRQRRRAVLEAVA